jgi:hypothetical protein
MPKLERVKCPKCGTGDPVSNARQLVDEHNRIHHDGRPVARTTRKGWF